MLCGLVRNTLEMGGSPTRKPRNEHRAPVTMEIPVHPKLQEITDATPPKRLTFLTTAYGKPFTVQGISGAMKDWCTQTGIPHCSSHGPRKSSATRLAEADCSPHQIVAITGHKSLKEVEVYTKAAGRKGWHGSKEEQEVSHSL